jgi:Lon protease-like protein
MNAASPPAAREIPIFPLGTVLFPEGVLPLRIFEARYMDMARGCLRDGGSFGVCLITDGGEVGAPAEHETTGCAARIEEVDMTQLGLLRVRVRGEERFEVLERRVQPDGLIMARVRPIAADAESALPDDLAPLGELAGRIADELVAREADPLNRRIAEPFRLDSAVWVSNRLSEILPWPMPFRQRLMALTDPLARLSIVAELLARRDSRPS